MGQLTPAMLDVIVAGCPSCGDKRVRFQTLIDIEHLCMMAEPTGRTRWAHDGDKFVDGVYRAHCVGCEALLFSSEVCPRCNAPDKLEAILESESAWDEPPEACPSCGDDDVLWTAFVPATVTWSKGETSTPKTDTEPFYEGFHPFEAACRDCGVFEHRAPPCPLCQSPGPLRPRP